MGQSREDLGCEIDLSDKLDKLGASYGIETPIYDRISQAAQIGMEKWFEEQIIEELKNLQEILMSCLLDSNAKDKL